jgi:glucosyl-3-phosphoglycerate synthase
MTPGLLTGPQRFCHAEFSADDLESAKKATTVSVCLPARDEARTIGPIVETIRADLQQETHLVDEIIVVNDRSIDATAAVAAGAGATVLPVAVPAGSQSGKGAAMATALTESRGDLLVFLDADIEGFSSHFVVGLLGPLLCDRSIGFVKASYQRPLAGVLGEGGRVTELAAKPLLASLHRHVACFTQPLAGEIAARRCVLEDLSLPCDYGVDVAVLIDVARRIGVAAMAGVDLGERRHRNRPLSELAPQARSVARVILERAGVHLGAPAQGDATAPATGFETTPTNRRVGMPDDGLTRRRQTDAS